MMQFISRIATAVSALTILLFIAFGSPAAARPSDETQHRLSIDDVLDTVSLERAVLSPDGRWVAAVVQRPARKGEIFGRTAYEVDPSRSDIVLISVRSGKRVNITNGASDAAGFWCPVWSPDGQSLAMLSTKPEGHEPMGGDNVRLYVWHAAESHLERVSPKGILTQTRYGSGLYALDIRGGAGGGSIAHICRDNEENAPFAWLDQKRLLALMLPDGGVSALVDEYSRPAGHVAWTQRVLRSGEAPTATSSESGSAPVASEIGTKKATLTVFDISTRAAQSIAPIPVFPFKGSHTIAIAPDGLSAAILVPQGSIAPRAGEFPSYHDAEWQAEKSLGLVALSSGATVRWARLPADARYPLELLPWSTTGRAILFRARNRIAAKETAFFSLTAESLEVARIGELVESASVAAGPFPRPPEAAWVNDRTALVRGRSPVDAIDHWWIVDSSQSRKIDAGPASAIHGLARSADGTLLASTDSGLARLNAATGSWTPAMRSIRLGKAELMWPRDPSRSSDVLIFAAKVDGNRQLIRVQASKQKITDASIAQDGEVMDVDINKAIWKDATSSGLHLKVSNFGEKDQRRILSLDEHLSSVTWGETKYIDYIDKNGTPLKGAVILPPNYKPGTRYPLLVWAYTGYVVGNEDRTWFDPYLPGLYNLQLYAAQGYVILVPSMPMPRGAGNHDIYGHVADGVFPAVDRMIALGFADPDRIGVFGQSFGGYSVYSLVTQSDRFRAAVAIAGITDLTQTYLQFNPIARGYDGEEHEASDNASILELGRSIGVSPVDNPELYTRNSPLTYVNKVRTPLLLAHGELDIRDSMAQAETFFYALYRQGKPARLLRYWGEGHSIANSPANVRNLYEETLAWFDRHLVPRQSKAERPSSAPVEAVPTTKFQQH